MSSQFQAQQRVDQPIVVQPAPESIPLPPQQHVLYGGIGLVSIGAVTLLIRELRLLAETLGK
ncbi:MAG: hypothetical protein AAFZ17_01510 [Cyanobacteria bacterium J06650_10]